MLLLLSRVGSGGQRTVDSPNARCMLADVPSAEGHARRTIRTVLSSTSAIGPDAALTSAIGPDAALLDEFAVAVATPSEG